MSDALATLATLISVTLLTGFLGSGKTTVLNQLVQHPALSKSAVIINEFGEIGLDHLLVARSSEDLVQLNSGCLCCTIRGDLITTLRDLFLRRVRGVIPEFQRVIIETTGLADPAPILHTILSDPLIVARYRLDGVVTTVDAVNGAATLDRQVESVKQAAVADRLLLTKCDLADAATKVTLKERLRSLNPGAAILEASHGAVDPAGLFDLGFFDPKTKTADVQAWLNTDSYGDDHPHHAHDVNRHDDRIRAYCVTRDTPISWDGFSLWLKLLTMMRGDDLLRVKGIIDIAERPGQPVVVQGVQHLFHPPVFLDVWPDDDHRTRIVFITRDIPKDAIDETLRGFEIVPP